MFVIVPCVFPLGEAVRLPSAWAVLSNAMSHLEVFVFSFLTSVKEHRNPCTFSK